MARELPRPVAVGDGDRRRLAARRDRWRPQARRRAHAPRRASRSTCWRRRFEGLVVRIARHMNRIAEHDRAASEGEAEARPVPALEIDPPARHDRDRHDRPSGQLRQRDDARAADPRDLRNVGGHHHHLAVARAPEASRAAPRRRPSCGCRGRGAPEPRMARTPRCRRAMALNSPSPERETRLAALSCGRLAKWIMKCCPCHMAAITGICGPMRVIGIRRLHDEAVRALHERQIARDQKAEGFLDRARAGDALDETHRDARLSRPAGRAGGAGARRNSASARCPRSPAPCAFQAACAVA